jgi:hypothetical protein
MGIVAGLAALPLTGPLSGLAWIARRIAEAADQELNDPARIEAELLALERQLEAGEIDSVTHELREAALLEELAAMQANPAAAAVPGDSP